MIAYPNMITNTSPNQKINCREKILSVYLDAILEQTPLSELHKRLMCSSRKRPFFRFPWLLMLFSHNQDINSMFNLDKTSFRRCSQASSVSPQMITWPILSRPFSYLRISSPGSTLKERSTIFSVRTLSL